MKSARAITILMAEDDEDDRMLVKEAFEESRLLNDLRFVGNGEELLDYLRNQGSFADTAKYTTPDLILLDLNMPRKDGREALQEIKSDPRLRRIPVVILTTSNAEEDILRSYDSGVNSFIKKPVTFDGMIEILKCLGRYWLQIVELPVAGGGR